MAHWPTYRAVNLSEENLYDLGVGDNYLSTVLKKKKQKPKNEPWKTEKDPLDSIEIKKIFSLK